MHVSPTGLMAMSIPLCQVLVRFFPRRLISSLISSSFREGLGWVGVFLGVAWDTNTAGMGTGPPTQNKECMCTFVQYVHTKTLPSWTTLERERHLATRRYTTITDIELHIGTITCLLYSRPGRRVLVDCLGQLQHLLGGTLESCRRLFKLQDTQTINTYMWILFKLLSEF